METFFLRLKDVFVNFKPFPDILDILLVAILPVTRFIVGTTLGSTATIVPLVIAAAPFVARMVESSLKEVDAGVIEAAQSMGANNFQIITKVLIPEANVPDLQEVDPAVKEKLTFIPVKNVDEVLDNALLS